MAFLSCRRSVKKQMNWRFLLAVGILSGTIIGAGVFSLPYIFSVTGAVYGLICLVVVFSVYAVTYSMYADLLLLETKRHDFLFLAKKHLPPAVSPFANAVVLGGLVFALVVYLALIPSFVFFALGVSGWWVVFLFWLFSSLFLFIKTDSLGVAEIIVIVSIIAAVAFMMFLGFRFSFGRVNFLPSPFNSAMFFLPFGPLLFSFAGRSALGSVVEVWREAKSKLRRFSIKSAITAGVFIPAAVYILFIFSVLKIAPAASEDAISALLFLPLYAKTIIGIVGFLTIWTSYVMLESNVKNILVYDARVPKILAFGIPLVFPLVLFAAGFNNFLETISIAGGVFVAIESIVVVWMWRSAFKNSPRRPLTIPLFLIFGIAFLYAVSRVFV